MTVSSAHEMGEAASLLPDARPPKTPPNMMGIETIMAGLLDQGADFDDKALLTFSKNYSPDFEDMVWGAMRRQDYSSMDKYRFVAAFLSMSQADQERILQAIQTLDARATVLPGVHQVINTISLAKGLQRLKEEELQEEAA